MEPVDYLAVRLTGKPVATPASMILSWLTDNRPGTAFGYHADLVRRARRDPRLLPELVPTGSVQGPLLASRAAELGLPAGVPVGSGGAVLQAGSAGCGAGDRRAAGAPLSGAATNDPGKGSSSPAARTIATAPVLPPASDRAATFVR